MLISYNKKMIDNGYQALAFIGCSIYLNQCASRGIRLPWPGIAF